ncbi:hypothetical protein [Azoarcus olearius]|uniref:Uncharacterized protein n=1 Tax=Azoarcus sp. (strain BH72) TaxID=418699 RepID=A1K7D0_AZOSB|nr:hypothetical protein [Azoarcus olearius]ANQ85281.1 hypothetical protein dqs_2250 [Azoarcus olearius]CAL94735.1 conserved hypothetical protein [Azoarcus olearius]
MSCLPPSTSPAAQPQEPPKGELRRCPTCNRWGGVRRLADDGHSVELDPVHPKGPCQEGPWHGSLRGPRNACGQWLQWSAIVTAPADASAPSAETKAPPR